MTNYARDQVINALLAAASYADKQGNSAETDALLKPVLAIAKHKPGASTPYSAIALIQLADSYAERGLYNEAEQLYKEAILILEFHLGTSHLAVGLGYRNLSEILSAQGKKSEAKTTRKNSQLIMDKFSLSNDKVHFLRTDAIDQGKQGG